MTHSQGPDGRRPVDAVELLAMLRALKPQQWIYGTIGVVVFLALAFPGLLAVILPILVVGGLIAVFGYRYIKALDQLEKDGDGRAAGDRTLTPERRPNLSLQNIREALSARQDAPSEGGRRLPANTGSRWRGRDDSPITARGRGPGGEGNPIQPASGPGIGGLVFLILVIVAVLFLIVALDTSVPV